MEMHLSNNFGGLIHQDNRKHKDANEVILDWWVYKDKFKANVLVAKPAGKSFVEERLYDKLPKYTKDQQTLFEVVPHLMHSFKSMQRELNEIKTQLNYLEALVKDVLSN